MYLTKRQNEILRLLKSNEQMSVDELVEKFAVTPQTIRADLNELSNLGELTRFHGGARLIGGRENVEYEARRQMASEQKTKIGIAAAKLVPNNSSLFINIGTTTEAFSDALMAHEKLMVITNNINVASRLRLSSCNEVIIACGSVRSSDGAIIGEAAVEFIKGFKVDYAIIGVSALDSDGSLLDFDYQEVKVAQAIIENARHVILVSDGSKLEQNAPVRIGHISQINTLVTDQITDQSFRQACLEAKVTIIEVA